MKILKIIPTILIFIIFFSCHEIKNPLKEQNGNTCGDETAGIPIRKILVEDYTGQRCLNCPAAAEILHNIIGDYCDHIIPVAVHATAFASPNDDFPYDYRTETGDELADFFSITSLPKGIINRTEFDGNVLLSRDAWRAAVNVLYDIPPEADITIESNYDNGTNKITVTVSVEFLKAFENELKLGLYLTEDSIVSPQLDGSEIIDDYVHRHMLRKGVNGAFGEKIASSAAFGEIIEKTFSFNVDAEWVIEHCELVAFICNGTTNEIIQAESAHVIQN